MRNKNLLASSFRDPSGYVFNDQGIIKRAINPIYFKQYNAIKLSGFYDKLFNNRLLIPHEEISSSDENIIIQPEQIPFITYPYEWSFNQYKEAALLTLKLQKYCLQHNFSLKDASAFNVVFYKGSAMFIDTLSIDFYEENTPWRAYKQFVTHFLGPLVLAKYNGAQMLGLLKQFLDGVPTKTISSLLPLKTKLNPFLYTNIHLLAKFENKHNDKPVQALKKLELSKNGQLKIIDSLYNYIKTLTLNEASEWGNYYDKINYSEGSFKEKSSIIKSWISNLNPKTIIDVGGNDGTFVRALNMDFDLSLVGDIDNNAVDANYKQSKTSKSESMLPFMLDVLNPTPSIGFNNEERLSFLERIKVLQPDVTMALAVIHHMTLSGNVAFEMSAKFFAKFSKFLIIEFPKRSDSWVEHLLDSKAEFRDHFDFYSYKNFEDAFLNYFTLIEKRTIEGTHRIMYFLALKDD